MGRATTRQTQNEEAARAEEVGRADGVASLPEDICDLVQVRIPGLPVYISVARHAVDAISEQLHFPPEDRSAVELAVGEACNNAVLYGRASEGAAVCRTGDPTVLVACRILRDALEIDVTNEGNGFHPVNETISMPRPELLTEHGRGLALMMTAMDSVEFLSQSGRTIVRMRKRRPGVPNEDERPESSEKSA